MKQTITQSKKNIEILNRLIDNGLYYGYVENEKFELQINGPFFAEHFRIIGIANDKDLYEIRFSYMPYMKVITKVFEAFSLAIVLTSFGFGIYELSVFFAFVGLIPFVTMKYEERKEISRFTDRLLKYHKATEW